MGQETWKVLHSSDRDDWGTPDALYDVLDSEFRFCLDASAQQHNSRCARYISPEEDALSLPVGEWHRRSTGMGAVWLNPPYGRDVARWVDRAIAECEAGATVVLLLFASTDTAWWRRLWDAASEVRFLTGRLHFSRHDGTMAGAAPKGSAIVVLLPPAGLSLRPVRRVSLVDAPRG